MEYTLVSRLDIAPAFLEFTMNSGRKEKLNYKITVCLK